MILVCAGILLDLGTRTSRLPQFRRRCEDILSRTSSKRSNGTSASSGALARQPSTGGTHFFHLSQLLFPQADRSLNTRGLHDNSISRCTWWSWFSSCSCTKL